MTAASRSIGLVRSTLLGALALTACAAEPPGAPPVKSDDPLQLTQASKERLAGEFTHDGVTVRFDSIRTAALFSFEIRAADGRPLIRGEQIEQNFVTTVLGDRLSIFYGDGFDEGLLHQGDQTAMGDLEGMAEYAVLPWLSYELGLRGYNGVDFPAVLALHMFNRSVAERLEITIPQVEIESKFADEDAYCGRPTANQCYGMCGRGCSCWSFVCGDCCYHGGCARHDGYCRGGGFWDTAKCWTTWGGAFFGC